MGDGYRPTYFHSWVRLSSDNLSLKIGRKTYRAKFQSGKKNVENKKQYFTLIMLNPKTNAFNKIQWSFVFLFH